MKKIFSLISVTILLGCTPDVSLEEGGLGKDDCTITRSASENGYDYDLLAKLFIEDTTSQDGLAKAYTHYQSLRLSTSFAHKKVMTLGRKQNNNSGILKVVIIVESQIYSKVKAEIERYAFDINLSYGCEIIMEIVDGGTHKNIKDLILSHLYNLNGVVFIGDIPAAWFETANDFNPGKYSLWPCDLYYMDMDGIWSDTDGNDIYDSHTGNILPDIFIGRISVKNMGALVSEEVGLKLYLDKNHNFWNGDIPVNRRVALSYTEKDWVRFDEFRNSIKHLYGTTQYVSKSYGDAGFGQEEYLSLLKDNCYEFIQLSCHATYYRLAMTDGSIYSNQIYQNSTEAIGYNLYCCSGCNWTAVRPNSDDGYIAGAHIYNPGKKSLVVVGSTKTGSMLEFEDFYIPLGEGKTIGESLKKWWWGKAGKRNDEERISWFYGMTIIGDPMISFSYQADNNKIKKITLNGFDTNNPSSHRYVVAQELITANDYVIPAEKYVIFDAPEIILNPGFGCQNGGEFRCNR